ncbi:MAG: type II secretion system protein [Planctomycetota bacterium]|nr:type II secretion system protein [Planctomycetota bacterium]
MATRRIVLRGFTLVEILIVVVILGVLSSLVVPQFAQATQDSQITATKDQLEKIRRAIQVYYVRTATFPDVTPGQGTWGGLIGPSYMRTPPVNAWTGGGKTVVLRAAPDVSFQATDAWIYDPSTGQVWAGGFDSSDAPHPR